MTTVKQSSGGSRAVLTIALALVAFALLPQLARPWIRMRADSWFHAAVVSVIQRGGVPPEDPYFAGMRLQYMWFFHWLLAGLERLLPVGTFWLMVVVNGAALLALCLVTARLGRRLAGTLGEGGPAPIPAAPAVAAPPSPERPAGRSPAFPGPPVARVAWLSALVMPLGLGVLFWLFMPFRVPQALFGHTGSLDQLAGKFRLTPLDVPTTRAFMSDFGSCPFFLNKFMVGTAYGLALLALVGYLDALIDYLSRPRFRPLLLAALMLLATLLFHPVVGLTAVAVSGLTGVVLFGLGPNRGGLHMRQAMQWGGAAAVAFAVATPYLRSVTHGKPAEQLVPFHFDLVNMIGIVVGCSFVMLAAVGPLRRAWASGRVPNRFYALWCVMTFVFGTVIRLPGPNTTDKFTYLVYVPLVAPAAIGLAGWARTRGRVALLLLLLAPANLIGWAGYWGDPDRSARPPDLAAAYGWLARSTPADAVTLDNHDRCDLLVLVPRSQYWGRQAYADQWGYDRYEMDRRRTLRDVVYDPARPVTPADLERLGKLKRPVFVLWRQDDFTSEADFTKLDATPDLFERVFDSPTVRVYRVRSSAS